MAGYEVEEIIGKDFREFIAPEDMAKVFDYYTRRQAGENVPHEYEFNALHRDRKTRLILNMTVAIINYSGRVATMGTLKDITESVSVLRNSFASQKNSQKPCLTVSMIQLL